MSIQRVRSKWLKAEVLNEAEHLRPFIPETFPYNRLTVEAMLERFGMIYVKPVEGTFGKGVIRVEKRDRIDLPYAFQSDVHKYAYASFAEMFDMLEQVRLQKPYLSQQGIELLQFRGRRFDLRVMVQKYRSRWRASGVIGRLAARRKIVTNYHSGGTPLPVNKLMAGRLSAGMLKLLLFRIRKLSRECAEVLEHKFPGIKEVGVDVALDQQGKPWILEINTKPDPYIFRKLPDPSVFRRICRYAAAYGVRVRKRRRR